MPRKKAEKPKRKDGLYEVKVTIGKNANGSLIRKSFYSSISKADATSRATEYKINKSVAEHTGQIFVDSNVIFGVWCDRWLKSYVIGKVKDNTYSSNYEIPIRLHIKPKFGTALIGNITPIDIQTFLDEKSRNMSVDFVLKLRNCLKQIFDTAIENKLCTFNPVTRNIKVRDTKENSKKRFYTAKQRDLIVEYAKGHIKGLPIILMLYTGISRSELLGLQWEDVEENTVHIRRSVIETTNPNTKKHEIIVDSNLKNQYRKRDIPIPQWLSNRIGDCPRTITLDGNIRNRTDKQIIETSHIFHSTNGKVQTPHNFSYYVYLPFMKDMHAFYEENGIDIPILNPHELRHTVATLWALDGIDVYTIAKLGGWSDLKMLSKVYGHSDIEVMRSKLGYL